MIHMDGMDLIPTKGHMPWEMDMLLQVAQTQMDGMDLIPTKGHMPWEMDMLLQVAQTQMDGMDLMSTKGHMPWEMDMLLQVAQTHMDRMDLMWSTQVTKRDSMGAIILTVPPLILTIACQGFKKNFSLIKEPVYP